MRYDSSRVAIGDQVTRLASMSRQRFIDTCYRLITPKRDPGRPNDKVSPPYGFGPACFARVCQQQAPELRLEIFFRSLFLAGGPPSTYALTKQRRRFIAAAIHVVKLGCELYAEIAETLDRIECPIPNTAAATKSLRYEVFQKAILPAVIGFGGILGHLRRLQPELPIDPDLEERCEQLVDLCECYGGELIGWAIARPYPDVSVAAPAARSIA